MDVHKLLDKCIWSSCGTIYCGIISPVQFTSLGSGSHSPFPIHVAEIGPVPISPDVQVKVIFSPSNSGSS